MLPDNQAFLTFCLVVLETCYLSHSWRSSLLGWRSKVPEEHVFWTSQITPDFFQENELPAFDEEIYELSGAVDFDFTIACLY